MSKKRTAKSVARLREQSRDGEKNYFLKKDFTMKIILLGAPGAGKGTQAEVITKSLGIPQISTGNLIREALKSGSELGNRVRSFVESGQLVPDETVIAMLRDRIGQDDCKDGFILDGFPRTIAQAEALDSMGVAIDAVIDIEVSDEVIAQRLSGRRVCSACGSTYHIENMKPMRDGVCDKCGGALVQRKDDEPETVRERLSVYHDQTEPLMDYYRSTGKLKVIDGEMPLDQTTKATLAALEA